MTGRKRIETHWVQCIRYLYADIVGHGRVIVTTVDNVHGNFSIQWGLHQLAKNINRTDTIDVEEPKDIIIMPLMSMPLMSTGLGFTMFTPSMSTISMPVYF